MNSNLLLGAALCAAAFDATASCGSAFCLVNTDWSAQGTWTEGVRFDLRYEFIDQDQPRAGRDRVAVGAIPAHHDEVETRNRNFVASLDWAINPAWAVSFTLPYSDREHFHIHNHHGVPLEERWSFRELGDVRVQARYAFAGSATSETMCTSGVTFGLKFPTGKYDVANGDGDLAERSLQPGTGTTDAILGYYWHRTEALTGWSYFTRVQAQAPINSRESYKAGPQLQFDAGARYAMGSRLGLMVQANAVWKGTDRGDNAEPEDSGQRALFVSPGISYIVGRDAQLYAFVQVPVYQWVKGVQLTADWSAVAGVSWRF